MQVAQIWRYPLKSAQGEPVPQSEVTGLGLEWDRQLAVVDMTTGRALTARPEPRLLMVVARVAGDRIRLETAAGQRLETDEAVSGWLGRPVCLARPTTDRQPEYDYPVHPDDETGAWDFWRGPAGVWHDSARTRVSIVSTASLRHWPVRRFRPNILVDGAGEDDLVGRRITIGSVVLDVVKRIDRCVMITRPQPGGIERDAGVLKTVLRKSDGFLGVGAMVVTPGSLQLGDEVLTWPHAGDG